MEIPPEELKERASQYLKRVSEIANSATKTAIISFGALSIVWFTQIHPAYKHLLNNVYPKLSKSYAQELKNTQKLKQINLRQASQSLNQRFAGEKPDESPTAQSSGTERDNAQTRESVDKSNEAAAEPSPSATDKPVGDKAAKELSKAIAEDKNTQLATGNSISFKLFGFEVPVPPLYASAAWSVLMLFLLVYLARARATIWTYCADALFLLKKSGKSGEALGNIAGSGPLWLAPPPSRLGRRSEVTVDDLRAAFGWKRLQTLPSIAATTGFLLLSLLQIAVTTQGFEVIRYAREFTVSVQKVKTLKFDQLVLSHPELSGGILSSVEASFLSLCLLITLIGTITLVVWWFIPSKISDHLPDAPIHPQRFAVMLLSGLILILVCLLFGGFLPEWGVKPGLAIARGLPYLMHFVAGSVIGLCLCELWLLARPARRQSEEHGKRS